MTTNERLACWQSDPYCQVECLTMAPPHWPALNIHRFWSFRVSNHQLEAVFFCTPETPFGPTVSGCQPSSSPNQFPSNFLANDLGCALTPAGSPSPTPRSGSRECRHSPNCSQAARTRRPRSPRCSRHHLWLVVDDYNDGDEQQYCWSNIRVGILDQWQINPLTRILMPDW